MNILIVSHGIPSKEDPQWGCFELDQARALSLLGHHVIIAAVDGRFRLHWRKMGIKRVVFGQIKEYLLFFLPLKTFIFPFLQRRIRARWFDYLFRQIVRENGVPDIIYAHYLFIIDSLKVVRDRFPDIPIVGIEHWSELCRDRVPKSLLQSGKDAYQLVDRLLAVSPSLQERIKKHFGKESAVVYDMVDQYFLDIPLAKRPSRNEPFRFVSCGSLIPRKGFDVLIKAFAKIKDSAKRSMNVHNAFQVSDEWDVTGLTVLLIDDVATSGSTLHEAATALYRGGAQKVLCVAFAGNRSVRNAEPF